MILLIYIGILFFCYGIYNLFCYFSMFPTAKAGRHLLKLYRKRVRLCDNIFMVQLAEKLVRKLDLEQKEPSMISAVLSYNGVNYSAAIYLFSRLLMAACGIISRSISGDAWYEIWSGMLCQEKQLSEEVQYQSRGWTDIWLLRFIEGMVSEKKAEYYKDFCRDLCSALSQKREKRLQQYCKWLRFLPGVFFFCQILLLISLLT